MSLLTAGGTAASLGAAPKPSAGPLPATENTAEAPADAGQEPTPGPVADAGSTAGPSDAAQESPPEGLTKVEQMKVCGA